MKRVGSLFSGIGGLDRAVCEVVGGEVAWFVENDPAASAVLFIFVTAWRPTGPACRTSVTSPPSTGRPSHPSTCCVAGRRARTSHRRDGRAGSPRAPVRGCGSPISRQYPSSGRDWWYSRMSTLSVRSVPLAWWNRARRAWALTRSDNRECGHSVLFSEVWPTSGTMRNGRVYRRPILATATGGNDFSSPRGLLPTLRTTDGQGPGRHGDGGADLRTVILLPTVTARDSANTRNATAGRNGDSSYHSGTTLSDVSYAERWGDHTDAIGQQERITGSAPGPTVQGKNGPVLSHLFAEWMMGFPPGWVTDVDIPKPTRRQPDRTVPMPRTVAIRLLGNAVVTDQATHALRIIIERMGK